MVQKISESTQGQSHIAQTIQIWIVEQVAAQLGVRASEIDPTVHFETYGLDSAQAMSIASKAEALMGSPISPILMMRYPTIASLSERLAEEFEADSEFMEI